MTPQEQLCEKMRVEQSAYCLWLTAQPPEEILHHAYEYSVREDIILATEEMNLTLAQVRALLKSPAPLADVYKDFSKLETDYMSIVAQCVEDRADDLLKKEQQQNPPKVYRQSVTYAREHGELQQYHASCHLNERCRDEIDAALAQRFDGMRLGAGAVEQVVAEYGLERTKYVLAAAIQTRNGDGRISHTNREWADSIRTIKDMDRRGFDRSCYYADLQAHGGHLFSTSGRYACGIKYDTHEGGKSMEMNSVMATEIVAAEVEHIVLPQIVSIKQASRMLGLPPYYLRRLCKEVPGVAFQSGIKWYINLGKLVDYYNNSGRNAAG